MLQKIHKEQKCNIIHLYESDINKNKISIEKIITEKRVVSPYAKEMIGIPLVGSAPCGGPLLAEQNIEEMIIILF